jgi:UTP--glucose-1-phosphate uridylyltransferase
MNSFNTHQETLKIIQKYDASVDVQTFNQSRHPRILKESLMPVPDTLNGDDSDWYVQLVRKERMMIGELELK